MGYGVPANEGPLGADQIVERDEVDQHPQVLRGYMREGSLRS